MNKLITAGLLLACTFSVTDVWAQESDEYVFTPVKE